MRTSKLSIGKYGMSVNKKIIKGKMAMKKLNARDDALRFKSSSKRLLKKNLLT
jgi:DNA uptake protein ComE-like DNA-binding protein